MGACCGGFSHGDNSAGRAVWMGANNTNYPQSLTHATRANYGRARSANTASLGSLSELKVALFAVLGHSTDQVKTPSVITLGRCMQTGVFPAYMHVALI